VVKKEKENMEVTYKLDGQPRRKWKVEKIGLIGPGIVGMPMAALLAHARVKIGTEQPAKVIVVQRNSKTSGWKVDAINQGKSVIGGIEPALDRIVEETVKEGLLIASHEYRELSDADVVLICVQTDKKGLEPDYGPMFSALEELTKALHKKPADKIPLVVFESTLAPSTMATLIKDHFIKYGLIEGKDILLGNSPNRVMPGRLIQRVENSDKLVAGLHPDTPKMIKALYEHIVKYGELYPTNSMTAEVVKTLENAYRDVRIAFASEVVRYCDEKGISFYSLRDQVNKKLNQVDAASDDPNMVPSGGLLVPMVGVGGHCLPKDGILLWWRKIESKADTSTSLIIKAREINNASPAEIIKLAERTTGDLSCKKVAILGTAYRFNSEDTRNSPSIVLAKQLMEKGCNVIIQDPYVKHDDQNLLKFELNSYFTNDLNEAISDADYLFIGTAHKVYIDELENILSTARNLKGIIDGSNIYHPWDFKDKGIIYTGIGRGTKKPGEDFVNYVYKSFRIIETGVANEVKSLIDFLNENYTDSEFNRVKFKEVQHLAASCSTGCEITDTSSIEDPGEYEGFKSELVRCAIAF
jgi:UDP-N-acetyl-D-mannosaminuronic acid dehydrogenase